MDSAIATALIALAGSVFGGLCVAIPSLIKQMQTSRLTIYRIDQLEKKQDKHNSIIERVFMLEGKVRELEMMD